MTYLLRLVDDAVFRLHLLQEEAVVRAHLVEVLPPLCVLHQHVDLLVEARNEGFEAAVLRGGLAGCDYLLVLEFRDQILDHLLDCHEGVVGNTDRQEREETALHLGGAALEELGTALLRGEVRVEIVRVLGAPGFSSNMSLQELVTLSKV